MKSRTQPLVSVIIPSYNCEAYIAETINSVLAQDYPSIELLIIDDGSTDKTVNIAQSYGDKLKLISQTNAGVCVARNRGIKEANGEFICLLDHDDYWYPEKISSQIKAFEKHKEVGIVFSNFTLWEPDIDGNFPHPETYNTVSETDEIDQEYSGWIYHLLLLDCWVLTSTAMFRSEVFNKCGIFDESLPFGEDWSLWLIIAREYTFLKLSRPTTLYRQHPKQGNRKVRDIDHRTALLSDAKSKWGLCSPDGHCITPWQFRRQLAFFHAEYGLHHLKADSTSIAFASFFKAWLTFPFNPKYLGYILAGSFGWRQKW